jgi:hypothetical protein
LSKLEYCAKEGGWGLYRNGNIMSFWHFISLYSLKNVITFMFACSFLSTCSWWGVFHTTLCDKVWQWLATGQWFSPGTLFSFTNKTDRYDITEILLKVTLNTINLIKVITKLLNSEQSYKGKVKTHNYINRQNQSTTGKLWKP